MHFVSTLVHTCNNIYFFQMPEMAETPNEFQLKNPPNDGISNVKFGPNSSQFLLVSSWDSSVRLYDIVANNKRMEYFHSAPVLDCCFHVSINISSVYLSLPRLLDLSELSPLTELLVHVPGVNVSLQSSKCISPKGD